MQLSTKVRYAARAMIELAVRYKGEPVQLNELPVVRTFQLNTWN